ncbi:hypothetical protein [Aeromonas salmonicida]|nr:hypothetical protein [Aeromonas salmonicida]
MKRTIRTRQVIQAEALFEQSALLASALSCICESNTALLPKSASKS